MVIMVIISHLEERDSPGVRGTPIPWPQSWRLSPPFGASVSPPQLRGGRRGAGAAGHPPLWPAGAARSGPGRPEGPRLRPPRPAQPGCPEPGRGGGGRDPDGAAAVSGRGRHGGRRAPRLRAQDQQVARPPGSLLAAPRARAPPQGGPAPPRPCAPLSSPFRRPQVRRGREGGRAAGPSWRRVWAPSAVAAEVPPRSRAPWGRGPGAFLEAVVRG